MPVKGFPAQKSGTVADRSGSHHRLPPRYDRFSISESPQIRFTSVSPKELISLSVSHTYVGFTNPSEPVTLVIEAARFRGLFRTWQLPFLKESWKHDTNDAEPYE